MPTFHYTARDRAGQVTQGQVEAESNSGAAAQLREMGLWVTKLRAVGGAPQEARPRPDFAAQFIYPIWSGVSAKDKSIFYRQLAAMIGAGMPLYQALSTAAEQTSNARLRRAQLEMSQQVLAGGPLSQTMARFPWLFSRLELQMMQAGELGGFLESVFTRLADYMERDHNLRMKIKQRTLYPKLLLLAIIFIPPIPTLVLAGPGPYFAGIAMVWGPIVLFCFFLFIAFRYLLKSQAFRDLYDQVKLALPAIGTQVRKLAIARFARAMAALYHAGVVPSTALVVSAEAANNAVLERNVRRLAPAVERGASMSHCMTMAYFFPPMFTGMVSTGEQTGDLDAMLDKAAEYYENEAEHATMQLVVILGVVLFLIMALIIAINVIGSYGGYARTVGSAGGG